MNIRTFTKNDISHFTFDEYELMIKKHKLESEGATHYIKIPVKPNFNDRTFYEFMFHLFSLPLSDGLKKIINNNESLLKISDDSNEAFNGIYGHHKLFKYYCEWAKSDAVFMKFLDECIKKLE